MNEKFAIIIAAVFFAVSANFFMLYRKLKKERHPRNTRAVSEAETKLRLEREQEDAAERVELQKKTFEYYEQVRKNVAAKKQKK